MEDGKENKRITERSRENYGKTQGKGGKIQVKKVVYCRGGASKSEKNNHETKKIMKEGERKCRIT